MAVLYDKRGAVAEIALNRPEQLNAYDTAMRDGLFEALGAAADDPEVRCVVLYGRGKAFSTGGDLREFGSAPSPTAARTIRWQRDVWGRLWRLPKITIAAAHGFVVGGGWEMMLLSDWAVADRSARFALPETGRAMIPGVAGTQTLPRSCTGAAAIELVLRGREIDATRARELGLVAEVVATGRALQRARIFARRCAEIEPRLLVASKRLVNDALDFDLAAGLQRERRLADLCTGSER